MREELESPRPHVLGWAEGAPMVRDEKCPICGLRTAHEVIVLGADDTADVIAAAMAPPAT